MQEWLISFANNHHALIYVMIILLACAEGPILSMIFGVLIKLGYFSFIPVYAALMLGDVIGDSIWYWIGKSFGHRFIRRFGKYVSVTEDKVAVVTRIFHKHKHKILFISKISNGFGFSIVTLISSGMVKIPFVKYLSINLLGQFIWSGLLIGVGYYFSSLYLQVDTWMNRIGIIALLVVCIFLFIGYAKYVKQKIQL